MTKGIFYEYAMSFCGLPYRWGGDDPVKGFDCSGLVIELLQSVGVFPRGEDDTAQGLYDRYLKHTRPGFGHLACYGESVSSITHIGLCLNEFLVLEAGGGGRKTLTEDDASTQNAYVRIRPIKYRGDLVGYSVPKYPWG